MLWISAGTLFVGLGVVGIFVPILPTTPFLLLAAFCYGRSSQRFLHWLLTNRWFGSYIRNYRAGLGLPLREKVLTILALWLTIGVSVVYVVSQWWLRLVLVGIALGVTVHLLWIKTASRDVACNVSPEVGT
ncbi:MAG: YbaN family protein [Anaerolineae bacterium]